jgi:hypothetical protein
MVLFFTLLFVFCCVLEAQDFSWRFKNTEQLLEAIMPIKPLSYEDYPTSFRWIVSIRMRGSYIEQLMAISLKKSYSGGIEATITRPVGKDLDRQIDQLARVNPKVSVSEVANSIKLMHSKLNSRECSALIGLAEEFERLSFSTVLPDVRIWQSTRYDIISQSLHGNSVQIRYHGPGPEAKIQEEPVLDWVERLRKLVNRECK